MLRDQRGSGPSGWEVPHSRSNTEFGTGSLGNPPSSSVQLRAGGPGLASYGADLVLDPGLVRCYGTGLGGRSPIIDPGATRWARNEPSPTFSPSHSPSALCPLCPQPPWQRGCIMPLRHPWDQNPPIPSGPSPKLILFSQSTKTTKKHPFLPIFSRNSRAKCSLEHSYFKTRDCLMKLDSFCCMIRLDYHQLIRLKTHGGFGFIH